MNTIVYVVQYWNEKLKRWLDDEESECLNLRAAKEYVDIFFREEEKSRIIKRTFIDEEIK